MDHLYEKTQEAKAYIEKALDYTPRIAIILGTGLGGLVDEMTAKQHIPYGDIPHFPVSTVESHRGELVGGMLHGKQVLVMAGRFHYYEGYTAREITFPVRVMKALGIRDLVITNVSGGLNPHFDAGQIIAVRDHINLMPDHPLRGPNDERLGLRFPDMKHGYPKQHRELAHQAAENIGYDLKEGVYVALQGPSMETPAEYRFLRKIGGDLVGMSTVPEVIVARHAEIPVLVLSMVSNVCFPAERIRETSLEDVVAVAKDSAPVFQKLVSEIVNML